MEPDVFVVGGGPAGLAVAIAARRKGMRVVVADGNRPPIDKACGEGLLPNARLAAAAIGVDIPESAGREFRGVHFQGCDGYSVAADFPHGRALGVRRTVLHQLLVEAAERTGVELQWNSPGLNLDDIRARWIIGADGATSRVRQWASLDQYAVWEPRFSFRRHYAIEPWSEYLEIYWENGFQIYITPVGEAEICVALLTSDEDLRLDAAISQVPELTERLQDAEPSSRDRGAITANARLREVARGFVALAGDASGSVDAITGEGICLAFRQAALLAKAMEGGDLSIYDAAHPRLSKRAWWMGQLMLMMNRGDGTRRSALATLAALPGLFQRLLALHAGG